MPMPQVEGDNLSIAWAQAFLATHGGDAPPDLPLQVTIHIPEGGKPAEDSFIRKRLDSFLTKHGLLNAHSVANTIFPQSLWNPSLGAKTLFKRYLRIWPRLQKCPANRRGHYFRRLVAARPQDDNEPMNQLAHVISTWKAGNHRHSALQMAVFDPALDHTDSRQLGFPCLHQICLTPLGANGCDGMAITGFYATQRLLDKAYGNFMGLCRLGTFMAHEMGLRLTRMTDIMASPRDYDTQSLTASAVGDFANLLRDRLAVLMSGTSERSCAAKEMP